jgi:hypothetical protein
MWALPKFTSGDFESSPASTPVYFEFKPAANTSAIILTHLSPISCFTYGQTRFLSFQQKNAPKGAFVSKTCLINSV